MYLSTIFCTVPSAISSSSALLNGSVSSLPSGKGRCVILDRVGGIEDLEAIVGCDEGLRGLIVDDDAIELPETSAATASAPLLNRWT